MTTPNQPIVIGVFEDRTAVAQAMNALLKAGFPEKQLGFAARQEHTNISRQLEALKEKTSSPGVIVRGIIGGMMGALDLLLVPITGPLDASNILATTLPATEDFIDRVTHSGIHAKPPPSSPNNKANLSEVPNAEKSFYPDRYQEQENDQEQQKSSIITGEVIGGVVGTTAAALLLPEIGPVVAGGLLATILSGAALGGTAGGFLETFVSMGVPKRKIAYYEQEIKVNQTLVTVYTADRQLEAAQILLDYGAHNVEIYSHHSDSEP